MTSKLTGVAVDCADPPPRQAWWVTSATCARRCAVATIEPALPDPTGREKDGVCRIGARPFVVVVEAVVGTARN